MWGNMKVKGYFEDLPIDGNVTLTCIFNKYDGVVDSVDVAQDTVRWQAFVNTVMKLGVP
jgi:hypothetical protein